MLWFPFRKKTIDIEPVSTNDLNAISTNRSELMNLQDNDAQLRIWLPEPLRNAMDQVTRHLDTTLSKYLREYFVVYLYGNHALVDMHNHQTGIFYQSPPTETSASDDFNRPMFSRSRTSEFIPGLGKNIVPFKIFLNSQVKSDLQTLAAQSGITLSHFVREILVSHFLGHTVWPERQQMLNVGNIAIANQWEMGDLEAITYSKSNLQDKDEHDGRVEVIYL